MSFPIQVILSADARLKAKAQAVIKRLGSLGGLQLAFWMTLSDHHDIQRHITRQIDEMLSRTAGRGEGGWAQVVLASGERDLAEVCAQLEDLKTPLPARARVAIVLADKLGALTTEGIFDVVHMVPRHLSNSQLPEDDRVQIAGNLLGLMLELARSPGAVDAFEQWTSAHGGHWMTLAQVTRFNAPAVQHLLARRLSGKVTAEMVASLEREAQQTVALSPLPHAAIMKAAREESEVIGREIAERVLRAEDEELLPDEEVLKGRVKAEADRLPERMKAFVDAHGRASMNKAISWLALVEDEIDRALALHAFGAIKPLRRELGKLEDIQRNTLEELALHHKQGQASALTLENFALPDRAPVTEANKALERNLTHKERSDMLFGAWALLVTSVGAMGLYPVVDGAVEPTSGSGATFIERAMAEPNTFTLLFGLGFLLLALVLAAFHSHRARQERRLLTRKLEKAMADYKEAWARRIGEHITHIGVVLQSRMLRFALDGLQREARRLAVVETTLRHLQVRYGDNSSVPPGTQAAFDADIQLSEAFYTDAQDTVSPEELLSRFDDAMRSARWRRELSFMDTEAVVATSRSLYDAFSESIPFESHMQLRKDVAGPTRSSIQRMVAELARYVPLSEHGVQRSVVLPESLRDAMPTDMPGNLDLYGGVSDVFVAVAQVTVERDT